MTNPVKILLRGAILGYRKVLSPHLGAHCRFYPSCSEYALLSLDKYGVCKGSAKAAWRVLRCNPFASGGVDYP